VTRSPVIAAAEVPPQFPLIMGDSGLVMAHVSPQAAVAAAIPGQGWRDTHSYQQENSTYHAFHIVLSDRNQRV